MLNQLKTRLGKPVALELSNGMKIYGELVEVDETTLRLDTDEGMATLRVDSVQIVWEEEDSLSESDFEEILRQVEGTDQARYQCFGFGGFLCPQSYTCRPPHGCRRFFCPRRFFSSSWQHQPPWQPPWQPQPPWHPKPPHPPKPNVPCISKFVGFAPPREADDIQENSDKGESENKEQNND